MSLARKAILLAQEVVLDHQLEWAVEKAKAGNLIGARYHVLFALGNRPQELQRFAQQRGPRGNKRLPPRLRPQRTGDRSAHAEPKAFHWAGR
jgi:hypothetical protein